MSTHPYSANTTIPEFPYTISPTYSPSSPHARKTANKSLGPNFQQPSFKRPIHTSYRHRRGSSQPVHASSYDYDGDEDAEEDHPDLDFASRRRSIDSERSSSNFIPRALTPIASRQSLSSSVASSSSAAHPWMHYSSSSTSALPMYAPPDPSSPFTAKFPLHDEVFDEGEGDEEEETILGHQSGKGLQPPRRSALFSNRRASLDCVQPADAYDSWTLVSADEGDESLEPSQYMHVPSSTQSARKRWDLFSVRLHLGVFHAKKRIAKKLPMKSSSSSSSTPASSYGSSLPSSPLMSPSSQIVYH